MSNADGIDESQWLPKVFNKLTGMMERIPPVNPFRAQHGNVKWEGESIKALTWLPDILFDRQIITKEHLDTCNSFFRALVHAKRTLKIDNIRGVLWDKHPSGNDTETDLFLEINREIPKAEMNILIWLVWDDYNRGNIELALLLIGTIQHGLENAQKVIERSVKLR